MDELVLTQLREAQSDLQFMVGSSVLDHACAREVTDLTGEMAAVLPVEPSSVMQWADGMDPHCQLLCLQLKVGKWTPYLALWAAPAALCEDLQPMTASGLLSDARLVVHSILTFAVAADPAGQEL